jgi:hypothetical protein
LEEHDFNHIDQIVNNVSIIGQSVKKDSNPRPKFKKNILTMCHGGWRGSGIPVLAWAKVETRIFYI